MDKAASEDPRQIEPLGSVEGFVSLTGVQLEEELDGEVVEMTAVLDDLDERRKPALARGEGGDGDGAVELANHWDRARKRASTCVWRLGRGKSHSRRRNTASGCRLLDYSGNKGQIR